MTLVRAGGATAGRVSGYASVLGILYRGRYESIKISSRNITPKLWCGEYKTGVKAQTLLLETRSILALSRNVSDYNILSCLYKERFSSNDRNFLRDYFQTCPRPWLRVFYSDDYSRHLSVEPHAHQRGRFVVDLLAFFISNGINVTSLHDREKIKLLKAVSDAEITNVGYDKATCEHAVKRDSYGSFSATVAELYGEKINTYLSKLVADMNRVLNGSGHIVLTD